MKLSHITFISAGAGSGKTYHLAKELEERLRAKSVTPAGVIGTTFTNLAAGELRQRVRQRLHSSGLTEIANQMDQAKLGTVNSVCGQLLKRFAFEAGLSPQQNVIEEDTESLLFGHTLEAVLTVDEMQQMNQLAHRLSIESWKNELTNLVQLARSNNFAAEQCSDFAEKSASQLLAHLPSVSKRDLSDELYGAITLALSQIDLSVDKTKNTKDYQQLLFHLKRGLQQNTFLWKDWAKAATSESGAKSRQAVEPVQIIAGDFEKHAQLHQDIRQFIELMFTYAAKAMDAYQQMKQQRYLLDFTDQEQLLYQVLDHPDVKAALSEELELLMVDEFQDTSPMQLALFLKLSALANHVIWVGDVKQAIYGFRGSDPVLMNKVLDKVLSHGGELDILKYSWRSRPELVEYANELFVPAFSDHLPRDRVRLTAAHTQTNAQPAVHYWELTGSNADRRMQNLAEGLLDLKEQEYKIFDRNGGTQHTLDWSDIAILARSNDDVDKVADALTSWSIPCHHERSGLMSTPEAALVIAGIKLLIDERDTLAMSEIKVLTECQSPQYWLADRIEEVKKQPGSYASFVNGTL